MSFINWISEIFDILLPNGSQTYLSGVDANNAVLSTRRDVIIEHLDRAGRTIRQYTLINAIPVEFQPASDFSADGDDTYSIEKLVLKYESFEATSPGQEDSSATNIKDVSKRLIRNLF